MKYPGSKNRVAKKILSIILRGRLIDQPYVEPFFGGGNSMQHADGVRIGGEFNFSTVAFLNCRQRASSFLYSLSIVI